MKEAVLAVINSNITIREAARQFEVTKSALQRYVAKYRNTEEDHKVFTDDEEQLLREYLINASNMCYGLSAKECRLFAYRFAVSNQKPVLESWSDKKCAGEEWMKLFRARHKLSLRTPEATSLSRATSFNKHNVSIFFTNLRNVIEKHGFTANQIYNCDETAVTTVHKPPKIMASCGQKQVGKITSGERGVLQLTPTKNIVTPESIRPHVKAPPRKLTQKRKKVTSTILTDTPVIEEKKQKEQEKIMKEIQKTQRAKIKSATKNLFSDSSDSDVSLKELCDDNSSDYSGELQEEEKLEICANDFVIVKYPLKKTIKYYVGQVEKIESDEFFVNFLKKTSRNKFLFPEKRDEDSVSQEDMVIKLPNPLMSGGTERVAKQYCFDFDFSPYNMELLPYFFSIFLVFINVRLIFYT
ncbi:hypothetical protein PPYR_12580 [Photinus pyralis]|uniref:HTH psq-type domain-containing protein n=1 Tax=Photinus pyralis TaxID=7054 RepID=A0A5N4A6K4_PHOPY|nr:hypothetical protein PPYR_12580 [Photinus pyralis]